MKNRSWSLTFRCAAEGVLCALRTQVNMRIHAAIAIMVIVAGIALNISRTDWLFVLFSISLVIVAELLNTAIEAVVDLASPQIHPLAKVAKDTAAGAVLLAAVFAVITGLFIFWGPVTTAITRIITS